MGSGIAGLYFALKCARFARVIIATKDALADSNTSKAQGGIAAAMDKADSPAVHYEDTMAAGDGLCDAGAVKFMVENAPACITDLEKMGVRFNHNDKGRLHLALEGGHHAARIVHVNDHTGEGVISTLTRLVKSHPSITVLENYFALDVCLEGGICKGAHFISEGEFITIAAKVTMLATGGAGNVYSRNTNPAGATGDGFAMAWRAGAILQNMEFVQFHPTMLYTEKGENFLISEAVRGFGAELINKQGKAFMKALHPMGSLAPRDVVTRAIREQMVKDGSPCVYLDTARLNAEEFAKRFPTIYKKCLEAGIDITQQPIPVAPAAHYMCGGVATGLAGSTNVPGLYACGETACTGVHGANRLASNSLLEGLVFAQSAAKDVEARLKTIPAPGITIKKTLTFNNREEEISICTAIKTHLGKLMWEKAGIIRSKVQLCEALAEISQWESNIIAIEKNEGTGRTVAETLNLLQTARFIVVSALKRHESRGAHYRSDFPEHNDAYLLPTAIQNNSSQYFSSYIHADSPDFELTK